MLTLVLCGIGSAMTATCHPERGWRLVWTVQYWHQSNGICVSRAGTGCLVDGRAHYTATESRTEASISCSDSRLSACVQPIVGVRSSGRQSGWRARDGSLLRRFESARCFITRIIGFLCLQLPSHLGMATMRCRAVTEQSTCGLRECVTDSGRPCAEPGAGHALQPYCRRAVRCACRAAITRAVGTSLLTHVVQWGPVPCECCLICHIS